MNVCTLCCRVCSGRLERLWQRDWIEGKARREYRGVRSEEYVETRLQTDSAQNGGIRVQATCLLAHLPTCPLAYLPTCPLAYLPTCPLAYLHTNGSAKNVDKRWIGARSMDLSGQSWCTPDCAQNVRSTCTQDCQLTLHIFCTNTSVPGLSVVQFI